MRTRKDFYTTHDIARILYVTPPTVIKWINDNKLSATRTVGGHRRISRQEFERFKRAHTQIIEREKQTSRRILIIDDEKSIQRGLSRVFEQHGFDVDVASDGFEAGTMLYQKRPDVVMLDLVMPQIDGFKTCRYIRDNHEFSAIKILVLTGYPSDDNFARARQLGADRCLAKPADNAVLLATVRELLGESTTAAPEQPAPTQGACREPSCSTS